MAGEIAVGVATNVTKSFTSRIWREIKYVFGYNNNIKKLKEKVKGLEGKEEAIKLEVDSAERNAEIIGLDVLKWLEKVDKIKIEANEVLKRTMNAQWDCLYCKCPKLHSRYKMSKQAFMKIGEVNELLQDASNFVRIGHPAPPGQMPWTSPQEFDGFGSRMRIVNDVMGALKDNSITIIGICGMAGVGKTTLVKRIADKVKDTKLFDEVAMAVVSNDPSIAKIQDELAKNLRLRIEEKTDRPRAERLYSRLMNKENTILIILDDLWQELDFRNIGIPVAGEREGLKVLLTSRYKGVCDKMRARPFEVEVLSKEESWHLFKETAEISDEANNVNMDIAKDVTKECGGLPLAIVIVAKALKNKEEYVWREAVEELKEASASVTSIPDMHNRVNSRIMLSYKYLADNAKKLLLLCSLFPEDYNIPLEVLVRYAKGLQLFTNITMASARDKVYSITDELKSCYLFLQSDYKARVKLHDVVRDFCLSIPSSDEHKYMVRHGGLKEWPQEDSYAPYTAISLTFDEIDDLPSGLDCPKLKLLLLKFKKDKLHIPEDFFKGMNELKVLEVSYLNGELPSSLQSLLNLRTLCFDSCRLYGGISIIGSLRKLEVLSFYNSHLDYFPVEVVELINLKSLDLRFEKGPPLPSGVLLRLKKLEELYLGSYFQEWKRNGVEAYSGVIAEISSLQNLQSIQFCAYDDYCLEQLLENLHLKKLIRFKITRTTDEEGISEFQFTKVLTLQSVNVDLLLKPTTQMLLKKTEDLNLMVEGLTNMVNELDVKGFANLKKLNMQDCDLKYLVDATDFCTSGGTFINLEELGIRNANNLEELCHGNLPLGSFARLREVRLYGVPALRHLWGAIQHPCLANLRILDIYNCGSIKSLFMQSSLDCLRQLQKISISKCPMLETLVSNDEGDEKETRDIEFLQLKILELDDLESFRCFSPKSGYETLFRKVMLPNLETMKINRVDGIKCIVDDQVPIGSLSKLQTIEVELVKSLEVVFDFTGLNVEGANIENLLGRLESLSIRDLPNLKHICRMLPEGIYAFKNLRSLYIWGLHNLRYLLSPYTWSAGITVAKMLVGLKTLSLNDCMSIEVVFDFRGINVEEADMESLLGQLESLDLFNLRNLKHIWRMCPKEIHPFKNLRSLGVWGCDNLRYLLSPSMAKMLVGLETLELTRCEEMEAVIGRDESVVISEIEYEEDSVKKKDGEETIHKIQFPKLRRLKVEYLQNFRMLCSENVDLEVPSLTELILWDCPKMTKFCVGQLSATRLHNVQVKYYSSDDRKYVEKNVALADFNSWLKDCESKIRCLKCSFFGEEGCKHFRVLSGRAAFQRNRF